MRMRSDGPGIRIWDRIKLNQVDQRCIGDSSLGTPILCWCRDQTTIEPYNSTTSLCYNFNDFKRDLIANGVRNINLIEYTALKMTFWIHCIGDNAAHIIVIAALKNSL